jgi:hypothetical protein
MMILEVAEYVLIALGVTAGVSLLVFWVWMLFDCLTRESREGSERLVWLLAIILTKFLGAGLYYFLRVRRRPGPDAAVARG